jgi:hypothetical protein
MEKKPYWVVVKRQGQIRYDNPEFDEAEAKMARQIITEAGDEILLFAREENMDDIRTFIARTHTLLKE